MYPAQPAKDEGAQDPSTRVRRHDSSQPQPPYSAQRFVRGATDYDYPRTHSLSASAPGQPPRPNQQSRPFAGPRTAWTSRSGLPSPQSLSNAWTAHSSVDPLSLQMTSMFSPPGLTRPGVLGSSDSSISTTPSTVYGSRTPQEFPGMPAPIAPPRSTAYSEPGPSTFAGPGPHRRASGKDEFDGPHQFLPKLDDAHIEVNESQLVQLTASLHAQEQDELLAKVGARLSQCAFDFVAKYQFPIPIEPDKRAVRVASDREWTEWCHLLKRLATKRRVPMRVLWNGQIKQLVTVLENSLETRQSPKSQPPVLKDDRNVLQLISAALQVAKMLKDPDAMVYLDELYAHTEDVIRSRAVPT